MQRSSTAAPAHALLLDAALLGALLLLACSMTGFWGAGFAAPVLHGPGGDWDWQLSLYAATRRVLLDYGQWPTWNPYTAGGTPLLANPEFPGLHPGFALVLWLGAERGLKLLLLLHLALGWLGLILLGRRLGLRGPFPLLAALLFAGCSVWSARLAAGHVMFQSLAYLPWAWWLVLGSRGSPWRAGGAGALLGLGLLLGGHYVFFLGLCSCSALVLVGAVRDPRGWLPALLALGAVAGLAALARWIPLVALDSPVPRLLEAVDGSARGRYGLTQLPLIWAGRLQPAGAHEAQPSFHGWLPALLLIPGLAALLDPRKRRAARLALLACVVLSLALSMAENLPLNLFDLLRGLPGLAPLRYPERFALVYAPLLCLTAALGAQWLHERLHGLRPLLGHALGVLLLGAALWQLGQALPAEQARFAALRSAARPLPAVAAAKAPFAQDPTARWGYRALAANRGCPACRDALGFAAPAPLAGANLVQMQGPGQLLATRFQARRIEAQLSAQGPVTVRVGQAARSGWQVTLDGEPAALSEAQGWLAAQVGSGQHSLVFRYRAPGAGLTALFLGLFVLSAAGCALWARRAAASPSRRAP